MRELPLRICFVCTGNTCRSPMAQAVANVLAESEEYKRLFSRPLQAYSAGLSALLGDPISQNAVLALENAHIPAIAGFDYHDHRAHTLTEEEAERYDLLVGISGAHAMELLMRFPSLASRITALDPPVSDPYGAPLARYEEALRTIITGVRGLLSLGEADHE